jgi:hypothetical protein
VAASLLPVEAGDRVTDEQSDSLRLLIVVGAGGALVSFRKGL